MSPTVTEASYHRILAEMYNELRSYREKEFRTFLFAFPIIGSAFISDVTSRSLIIMVSLFGSIVCYYIIRNIRRSMKIRKVIVSIQEKLGFVPDLLEPINPNGWANKKLYNHLGTMLYILIIFLEILGLWIFRFCNVNW